VFVGIAIEEGASPDDVALELAAGGFEAVDLTHDGLAKDHVRHMVGGRSVLAEDERLFRFVFPERPGALTRFLSAMKPTWNISLFHYRNQGADDGRVLVGMQVPAADDAAFADFLEGLAYPYEDDTGSEVYRLFLG
jgi:threonine dehydratase